MAKRTKGTLYRKTVTRVRRGKRVKSKSGFYRVRYVDADGKQSDHVLVLPNGGKTTDKDVAQSVFNKLIKQVDREAAGLVDPMIKAAGLPIRKVVADYLRFKKRQWMTYRQLDQIRYSIKRVISGMDRLSDFNVKNIDKVLRTLLEAGKSARTVNSYRTHARGFGEWCLKIEEVMIRNPADAIPRQDEARDQRKVRRALTIQQASKLLEVCGPRRLFYQVLLWSGLRVSEAARLQWGDVDAAGDRPCLKLRSEATKSRRPDVLPLHVDLAVALSGAKPPFAKDTDLVFDVIPRLRTLRGGWYTRNGEKRHLKGDLDRAGIQFKDDQGHTVDLHALRTTYISWLGQYGVDPRAQVALARHAGSGVTMKNYQDFTLFDLWGELAKVPGPQPTEVVALGVALALGATCLNTPVLAHVGTSCQNTDTSRKDCKTRVKNQERHSGRQDSNLRLPAPKAGALRPKTAVIGSITPVHKPGCTGGCTCAPESLHEQEPAQGHVDAKCLSEPVTVTVTPTDGANTEGYSDTPPKNVRNCNTSPDIHEPGVLCEKYPCDMRHATKPTDDSANGGFVASPQETPQGRDANPGLATIIEVWPRLTDQDRKAVVDAVQAFDRARGS